MAIRNPRSHRPRELRRGLLLSARLRTPSGWSDACVLNISSRGLLIHSSAHIAEGATVELRHRDNPIVARVIWRTGPRAGLCAEHRLPVEEILALGATLPTQPGSSVRERRKTPRAHDESRTQARLLEFGAILFIAASLSLGVVTTLQRAFARPLADVEAALSGQPQADASASAR